MLARASRRTIAVTDHGGGGLDFSWYVSTNRLFQRHLHVSQFSRSSARQENDSSASVVLAGVNYYTFQRPATPPPRVRRALFVGRLLPHKGVHDLIEALPSGVGLDIVGPETDRDYAAALRVLATDRDVRFVGEASQTEVVRLYQCALCVVLPSTYSNRFGPDTPVPELLGQTLLEGMACGTPAIATNVGGMPESVVDGETGYIVPAGDPGTLKECLERLAASPALVEQFGRAAAEHVRRLFTWELVVERCLDAYGRH
jgi:glycosyltransferase involved in cell wall biosynthesis